jgi:signal transduction histidine kinase
MYLFQYGVLCFIFVQSTIHSFRFASAYQELQSLKNNLKLQVESRTQDLAQVNSELSRAHSETKLLNNAMTSFIEDERKMLSRELHDDIGATLTGIRFNINTACKKLSDVGSIPADIIKTIQNAEESINILYQKVRGMVRKLRPEIIDTLGLETALNELVFSYSDLKIDLRVEGDCSKVSSECGLAIYRISQEAITNVLKYANATEIILKVVVEDDLHFSIKDNGEGFDTELTTGIGLISMRERATGLGGSFSIESNHAEGTEITVSVPLARDKLNINA